MRIAFDARCWSRPPHSFRRVLQNLYDAALAMGWDVELWMDSPLHSDMARYADRVLPLQNGVAKTSARVLWSPSLDIAASSLPTVGTIHDINPLLPDNRSFFLRLWRGARFRFRAGRVLDRVSRVSTDSEYSRREIARVFPSSVEKLAVVPLFVDASLRRAEKARMEEVLSSLGLSEGYVLFVGGLRRHKNWRGLMEAFARLPAWLRDMHHLVFAGSARRNQESAERYVELLGITGQVHLLGMVSDDVLPSLYTGASLFVSPSFLEGFGLPSLEAMACGVPVVASNCSCVPEILGDAPVYINPHDIAGLSGAMESVLGDGKLRLRLIEAGIKRAGAFNPGRTGRAMEVVVAGCGI